MKNHLLSFLLGSLLALGVRAEWRTEPVILKPGWNAIYPGVDASHVTIDELLASYPAVLEIWRWQPERADARQPGDLNAPPTGVEWSIWKRGLPWESTFTRLEANFGYLVRVAESSGPLTVGIKGRAALPEVRWRGDGLQLAGFPVITTSSKPTFSAYLAPTTFAIENVPILRYVGGPIVNGGNPIAVAPTINYIERGQAYWIRANLFSRYYGPLKIDLTGGGEVRFGTGAGTQSAVLKNLTTSTLTYTFAAITSEAAPPGQPEVKGVVPLRVKVDAESDFTPLTAVRTLTLPPGAITRIQITVDRTPLTHAVGTHYASMLKFTTIGGVTGEEVFVPVTAEAGSPAGLWIGEAQITQVGSVALRYERNAEGNTVYDNEGKPRVLEDLTTPGSAGTLPGVHKGYPLRILLHVNASGRATLLSHIYQGTLAAAPLEAPIGLVLKESLLDPAALKNALRLSVAHLPLETALDLGGNFAPGTTLTTGAPLTNAYNAAVNPFVHIYHPDHDNLNARFDTTQPLPAGRESFEIRRTISLKLDAVSPNAADTEWGASILTGNYSEFIEGPYKSPLRVQGAFSIYKVTDIPVITQ